VIDEMPKLLDRLTAAPAMKLGDHDSVPEAPGVYLFSEAGAPLYVGQTRNLKQRLRQHTSAASRQERAPFAFNLARKPAEERSLELVGTRKQLTENPEFSTLFAKARTRVAQMDVQFLEVPGDLHRYIFEPYATDALGTHEFNTFETH
jgi:GIY-YIG catalytic domain